MDIYYRAKERNPKTVTKHIVMLNFIIFFRTNPPMRGAFQMFDGEKKLYSLRKPFIVHLTLLFFYILHFFADQMANVRICMWFFFVCKFCDLYQYQYG
jgi:hypothetical protein